MPPDIIAGLIALTGPPGAAGTGKAAEPPASRTVSAAVFAALLTQSSPPTLKLAAPKTDAAPMVKLGLAAKQQTSKHSKTLSILKTMDTLPPLSFPSTGTATKASELPLLNAPAHKAAADDSKTVAAKAPALTPGAATPLNSSLDLVPIAVPVQAVPVQSVLPPASAPALAVSAPSVSAPAVSAPAPLASPSASVPVPALVLPQSVPAVQPAADSSPAPSGVSLPRTWTLPALTSAEKLPRIFSQSAPPATLLTTAAALKLPKLEPAQPEPAQPEPAQPAAGSAPAAVLQAVLPAVQSARAAFPAVAHAAPQGQVPLQGQAAPKAAAIPQAQAAPQGAARPQIHNPASTTYGLVSSSLLPLAAAGVLAEPAPGPALLPSAKSAGKFGQITLKPASQNADINTGTVSIKAPDAAGKAAAPAVVSSKTPPAASDAQRQAVDTEEAVGSKKPLVLEDALAFNSPFAAQVVPLAAQEANLGGKPLSSADHAALIHQVADGVEAMPLPTKPGGVQQMSLQLHPKDWGTLQVSVSVTPGQEPGAAKTVTAHLVAETPQVKAALQSQTGALHRALRASGLKLEHLTVSVKPVSETMKPAAQSASSGFSGGQEQFSAGTSQGHPAQTTPVSPPAGTQLGTSAGSSQNGRQGQPPASTSSTPQAEAAQEEIIPVRQTMRLSGRIDTHA